MRKVRAYRVPLLVVLLFILAEVLLFDFGLLWKTPFLNSQNSSYEGLKLKQLEAMEVLPEVLILGHSVAEFGINTKTLQEKIDRNIQNLAIPSSVVYEHSLIYKRLVDKFKAPPKATVLLVDYRHIPVEKKLFNMKRLMRSEDLLREEGLTKDVVSLFFKENVRLLRYRHDIEIALRGVLSGFAPTYLYQNITLREQIRLGWIDENQKHPEYRFKMKPKLKRRFNWRSIDKFFSFLKENFKGTRLILIESPNAAPLSSNFSQRMTQRALKETNLIFFNWRESIVFEQEKHFYNLEHLNEAGAEKFTTWLAERLGEL